MADAALKTAPAEEAELTAAREAGVAAAGAPAGVAGIIVDQIVALTGASSRKDFPEHLRRIRFKDPETGKALVFLASVPYQSIN